MADDRGGRAPSRAGCAGRRRRPGARQGRGARLGLGLSSGAMRPVAGIASIAEMEAVALIVALASFAVSWAALYATTLKRAHIAFQYTPLPGEWHIGGWQALVPSGRSHITLAFYVHNSGANAGILEAASATSTSLLDGVLREPVSWYPVSTAPDIDLSN